MELTPLDLAPYLLELGFPMPLMMDSMKEHIFGLLALLEISEKLLNWSHIQGGLKHKPQRMLSIMASLSAASKTEQVFCAELLFH